MIIKLAATARRAVAIAGMASHQHIKTLFQLLGAVKPPVLYPSPRRSSAALATRSRQFWQSEKMDQKRMGRSESLLLLLARPIDPAWRATREEEPR